MPMNSRLSAKPSDGPPLHPSELNLITSARLWLSKAARFAFARFLMIFFIGVVATLAWQPYGGAAREMIASWSPHLGWLAPPAAPADASPDQLATISLGLAVVRQSVDKLAADVTKLQATQQGVLERTSAPPPSPAGVPARKPAPAPSRAPPAR
jgi:hypothetical protein